MILCAALYIAHAVELSIRTSPPMSDAFSLERGWSVVLGALSKIPTGDRSQKLRKLFDEALQGDRYASIEPF
jgi:hypothetical protein